MVNGLLAIFNIVVHFFNAMLFCHTLLEKRKTVKVVQSTVMSSFFSGLPSVGTAKGKTVWGSLLEVCLTVFLLGLNSKLSSKYFPPNPPTIIMLSFEN